VENTEGVVNGGRERREKWGNAFLWRSQHRMVTTCSEWKKVSNVEISDPGPVVKDGDTRRQREGTLKECHENRWTLRLEPFFRTEISCVGKNSSELGETWRVSLGVGESGETKKAGEWGPTHEGCSHQEGP